MAFCKASCFHRNLFLSPPNILWLLRFQFTDRKTSFTLVAMPNRSLDRSHRQLASHQSGSGSIMARVSGRWPGQLHRSAVTVQSFGDYSMSRLKWVAIVILTLSIQVAFSAAASDVDAPLSP